MLRGGRHFLRDRHHKALREHVIKQRDVINGALKMHMRLNMHVVDGRGGDVRESCVKT